MDYKLFFPILQIFLKKKKKPNFFLLRRWCVLCLLFLFLTMMCLAIYILTFSLCKLWGLFFHPVMEEIVQIQKVSNFLESE